VEHKAKVSTYTQLHKDEEEQVEEGDEDEEDKVEGEEEEDQVEEGDEERNENEKEREFATAAKLEKALQDAAAAEAAKYGGIDFKSAAEDDNETTCSSVKDYHRQKPTSLTLLEDLKLDGKVLVAIVEETPMQGMCNKMLY
jgi:hypothetical protein